MTIRTPVTLMLAAALAMTATARAQPLDDARTANPTDAAICRASDGRLPPNVHVNRALLGPVRSMLRRSEEFRRQCEELAARPTVYVRVNLSVEGLPSRFCARSVIQRMTDGPLLIFVEIERTVNWAEWLAHEFEHVLEQAEGLRVKDLRNQKDSWESAEAVFETSRAIFAGRAVREQMRRKPPAIAATN